MKKCLSSYQRHSNSIILILVREKVSVFKLKSNTRLVADSGVAKVGHTGAQALPT